MSGWEIAELVLIVVLIVVYWSALFFMRRRHREVVFEAALREAALEEDVELLTQFAKAVRSAVGGMERSAFTIAPPTTSVEQARARALEVSNNEGIERLRSALDVLDQGRESHYRLGK